jgi:hypothetical protein
MTIMRSSYELTSATAGHSRSDQAMAKAMSVAESVAAIPKPRSHRVNAGTGVSRRAESSITIELA